VNALPSVVRLDPALGLADLFQVRSRSTRQADITVTSGASGHDGLALSVHGPLSPFEQDLLLGIHLLAMDDGVLIDPLSDGPHQTALWSALHCVGEQATKSGITVACNWRGLAGAALCSGFGSSTQNRLRAGLMHLAAIRLTVWSKGLDLGSSNLLSWTQLPAGIAVTLCPRLSWVLSNAPHGGIARHTVFLDMTERKLLQTDEARIAHAWLSAWAWPHKSKIRTIGRRVLADHIWADDPPGSTRKRRERRLTEALDAIAHLPQWHLRHDERQVVVRREPPSAVALTIESAALTLKNEALVLGSCA
jgi:hypothetical protein